MQIRRIIGLFPNRLLPLAVMFIMAGCIGSAPLAQPSQGYRMGQLLLEDSFETAGDWRQYDADTVQMRIDKGRFHMRVQGSAYYWTINQFPHEDAIIDVEVRGLNVPDVSGYGVICRANPNNNGNGYYFLISDDGSYSIRRGIRNEVTALRSWTTHPAIYTDGRPNQMRVICLDNYLALYVNDTFITEVHDQFFQQGVVGLGVVTTSESDALEVTFDDLRIWQASSE